MIHTPQKWEQEYRKPTFITLDDAPQKSVLTFARFLKKHHVDFSQCSVLDLGCGNGRNTLYFASRGAGAIGYDISKTAVREANRLKQVAQADATFFVHDIGTPFPLETASIDIILDITSSNALLEKEREVYLGEIARVTKAGAYIFVRTLCLDGDKNAKQLLKKFGTSARSYTMPQTGITETVFSKQDIERLYLPHFTLLELKKTTGYTTIDTRAYKRNFWLIYLQKR